MHNDTVMLQSNISDSQQTSSQEKPYKLGVALSGGGARGFAHVGALQALVEAGYAPDVVAGVSAGSVAGVMFCAGVPFERMLTAFADKKFTDFTTLTIRKSAGMFSLTKFKKFVEKTTGAKTFDDLKIPLYVGVSDLDRGVPVEFHSGDLGEKIIASCSIPIVFQPVKIGDTHYVDGGVLRNLPSWTIRDKCEHLIGINVSPLGKYKYKNSIMDVALRTYNLLAKSNISHDVEICDEVIVTPDLSGYQVFNLKDIRTAYLSGYAAAHRAIKDFNF